MASHGRSKRSDRRAGMIRRHLILLLASLIVAAAALRWGSGAALLTAVLATPALAWRYDNSTGALFPLALLFVIATMIVGILIGLLAIVHRG